MGWGLFGGGGLSRSWRLGEETEIGGRAERKEGGVEQG